MALAGAAQPDTGVDLDELVLDVPAVVSAGDGIVVRGSGADPGELVTLSSSMTRILPATPVFKIGTAGYCIISPDVNALEAEPVKYVFMGWQHLVAAEEEQQHAGVGVMEPHSENPYYLIYPAANGRVAQSKPYHGEVHPECWRQVVAGEAQDASEVNMTLTVKRVLVADEAGGFSTKITLPYSKVIGGDQTLTAVGAGKVAEAVVTVDVSGIGNEAPVAFIYAPELFENSWKTGVRETVILDGSYSVDNDGEIADYSWNLGDGTMAKGPVVEHAYAQLGPKVVTLTVEDAEGSADSIKAVILVS